MFRLLITKISNQLIILPRFIKRGIMIFFDAFSITIALLLAFSLRFDYLFFPEVMGPQGGFSNIFLMVMIGL